MAEGAQGFDIAPVNPFGFRKRCDCAGDACLAQQVQGRVRRAVGEVLDCVGFAVGELVVRMEARDLHLAVQAKLGHRRIGDIQEFVVVQEIAQHVRVFSARGTSQVYLERLQAIEADLRKHRNELSLQKQRQKLTAIEDTKRDLVRRGGDLATQIETAQTDLQTLLTRFESGHREVELAKAKLVRLNKSAEQARDQLSRLESQQARLDEMNLEIASLETAYKDYAGRYDEARLTDLASANAINIGAVDRADVPARPDNSRLFLLVVAAAGGIVLALLIAVVREYFDRRLANPLAAEQILGVPDLGSVEWLRSGQRPRLRIAGP